MKQKNLKIKVQDMFIYKSGNVAKNRSTTDTTTITTTTTHTTGIYKR